MLLRQVPFRHGLVVLHEAFGETVVVPQLDEAVKVKVLLDQSSLGLLLLDTDTAASLMLDWLGRDVTAQWTVSSAR